MSEASTPTNPITWFTVNDAEARGALGVSEGAYGFNVFLPVGLPEILPPDAMAELSLEAAGWFDFFYQSEEGENVCEAHVAFHVFQPGNDEVLAHVRWYPDGRVVIEEPNGRILLEVSAAKPEEP